MRLMSQSHRIPIYSQILVTFLILDCVILTHFIQIQFYLDFGRLATQDKIERCRSRLEVGLPCRLASAKVCRGFKYFDVGTFLAFLIIA